MLEDEFEYDHERNQQLNFEDIYDDKVILDKLPKKKQELERLLEKVKNKIAIYKKQFLQEKKELSGKYYLIQSESPMSLKTQFQ